MFNLKYLFIISIYKYRLYGFINLILFLLLFAGGISLLFLGGFSIIPRYLMTVGLMISLFCFFLLYWSIHCFIEYGKIKGRIEATSRHRKKVLAKTLD